MHVPKLSVVVLALTLVGCASPHAQKPTNTATQSHASKATPKAKKGKPTLIAPPPAYGNRVVSADAPAPHSG